MSRHTNRRMPRRGSALMMVITAMAAGVVLSSAYVAARTNGTVVGSNLSASSRARVEAESALSLAITALTTSDLWRTNHVDGVLFEETDDHVEVRVELIDLATGTAPEESTVDVCARVQTTVDGIERIAEANFFVALPEQANSIDVDLGEFALFASDTIVVRSEATVQPWSASPATSRGDPIRVATATGGIGQVQVADQGAIVSGVEFAPGTRSANSGPLPVASIPDDVAIPMPAPPQDFLGASFLSEAPARIEQDARIDTLDLSGGATLELALDADLLVEGDLIIRSGALLRVVGDSHLVIQGDASVIDGAIEVAEDASLVVHVGGDLDMRNASVLEPGGSAETWVPAIDRVQFVALQVRETMPRWRIRGRSVVKAECYAPTVEFKLQGRATLVGRVVAHTVLLEGRSSLFYDPSLDDRNGYTAVDNRAFDEDGRLLAALEELEDLSPESLKEASDDLQLPVSAHEEYIEPELMDEAEEHHSGWRGRSHRWWRGRNWHRPNSWGGGNGAGHFQRSASWSFNISRIGQFFGSWSR